MRPLLVLPLLVVVALPAFAQQRTLLPVDSTTVVAFHMTKGKTRKGRVVAADDSSLTVLTLAGATVVLPRSSIEDWDRLHGTLTPAGFRPTDLTTQRLFFGPTARTFPRGGASLADHDVFMLSGGYGVSDRVMLSAATSVLESFDSSGRMEYGKGIAYADGRVGLARGRLTAVAVGAFWGWAGLDRANGSVGAGYGVVTLGSNDHAVTVLGGYPFASRSFEKEAIVMLGGETRIGRRLKLMTELWKLPQISRVAGIYGVRYLGDEFSVEVGGGAVVVLSVAAHWRRN
jgi:hypothetical protein